jgi:hypothetical protein
MEVISSMESRSCVKQRKSFDIAEFYLKTVPDIHKMLKELLSTSDRELYFMSPLRTDMTGLQCM